jgi:transcriptional regulator with XRE-family HTH domain
MDDEESVGKRIKHYRTARGFTQVQLANSGKLSVSLLRKIESGERFATQPVVASIARVLGVDMNMLTGQPYDREGPNPDHVHDAIPNLRRALTFWKLPPQDVAPRSVTEIAADAQKIARLRQLDRNTAVVEKLPPLLGEAITSYHQSRNDGERAIAADALFAMLHAAHSVTYKLGYEDLSVVVEDRVEWLATTIGDPLMVAFSEWIRTNSLMRNSEFGNGLLLLESSRAGLEPEAGHGGELLRMVGSLHLRSAIVAARANRFDVAHGHIAEAEQIAAHLPQDTDGDWRNLGFGRTNVAIHAVATAVESGDGPRALALNDQLHLPETMVSRLPTRIGRHYLDLAKAQFWQGQHDKALASLQKARKVAPQQTRHHLITREITRQLVRSRKRASSDLGDLARWIGPSAGW